MHPLTTPQQNLTDALNATLITFNGNEQMLQNDMGNTRIQDAKTGNIMGLREGFVPVGLEEHGGIMYIASVNKEGKGEIGTIPSPVITYKPQDAYETDTDFFKELNDQEQLVNRYWVTNETESPTFEIYNDEINPEEIFIPCINNPVQNNKSIISSLMVKHLYEPRLIAITSKGEKDITPTVALVGGDYWFGNPNDAKPDLSVLNQPVEEETGLKLKHVNFLTYPKIQSGKLGIKFIKENINSFNLAPNGKNGKFYPTLQYTEDSDGNRHYYSIIYGVQYDTDSDVQVDSLQFSHKIEDTEEKYTSEIFKGYSSKNITHFSADPSWYKESDHRILYASASPIAELLYATLEIDDKLLIYDLSNGTNWVGIVNYKSSGPPRIVFDKSLPFTGGIYSLELPRPANMGMNRYLYNDKYYITAHSNSTFKKNWPSSDTKLISIDLVSKKANVDTSSFTFLYAIDLGDDPNKWIDLKIKYWDKNWERELGTFTMKYNPYYMDTLGKFIVDKYWKIHTFANGKQSFPQKRDYNVPDYGNIKVLELPGDQMEKAINSTYTSDQTIYISGKVFKKESGNYVNLISANDNVKSKREYNIDLTSTEIDIAGVMSTYLRQIPYTEYKSINPIINKISFIPGKLLLSEQNSNKNMTNTAGSPDLKTHKGGVKITYSVDLIVNGTKKATKYVTDKEYSIYVEKTNESRNAFYYGQQKKSNSDELINFKVSPEFVLDKVTFENLSSMNIKSDDCVEIQLNINQIDTWSLQKWSQTTHDLKVIFKPGTISINASGQEAAPIYVTNQSKCSVYPQIDAVVKIQQEDSSIIECPACVSYNNEKEIWNPLCINYKQNYIKFVESKKNNSESITNGYNHHVTSSDDSVRSSFTLGGLENYYQNLEVSQLSPKKLYVLLNNDTDYPTIGNRIKVTISDSIYSKTSFVGQYCLIYSPEQKAYTISSSKKISGNDLFRNVGIYEVTGNIIIDSQYDSLDELFGNSPFIDSSDQRINYVSINELPISSQLEQTVYCYAEDQFPEGSNNTHGYPEVIKIDDNIKGDTITFKCSPAPEFGYQKSINLYENSTDMEYVVKSGNNEYTSVNLLNEFGSVIIPREAPKYIGDVYTGYIVKTTSTNNPDFQRPTTSGGSGGSPQYGGSATQGNSGGNITPSKDD